MPVGLRPFSNNNKKKTVHGVFTSSCADHIVTVQLTQKQHIISIIIILILMINIMIDFFDPQM